MHIPFKSMYPKFKEVVDQCIYLGKEYADWPNNEHGQLAIQTDDPNIDNWTSGIGKSVAKTPEWEQQFRYIQPSLIGTPVDKYIKWLGIPVYRARIMLSKSKSCYSVHSDHSPRLHLPLITNKQCNFLITNPIQMFHLPANGMTTWIDTTKPHTFMNGSLENRFHLVMITKE